MSFAAAPSNLTVGWGRTVSRQREIRNTIPFQLSGPCICPASGEIAQVAADLADLLLSPMVPGPIQAASVNSKSVEDPRKSFPNPAPSQAERIQSNVIEKLSELVLCVDLIRESLENYEADTGRYSLDSPLEAVVQIEEI